MYGVFVLRRVSGVCDDEGNEKRRVEMGRNSVGRID